MLEKNYEYLSTQVFYSGFGDRLLPHIRKNMEEGKPEFAITDVKKYGNEEVRAILHFKKAVAADFYNYKKFELSIKHPNYPESLKQTYFVNNENNYTRKEAYNLQCGRAIYKEFARLKKSESNSGPRFIATGEKYEAWDELNFKKIDSNGNFAHIKYQETYGYNLEFELNKYDIKELLNKEEKLGLITSLKKGNRQGGTLIKGKEELRIYIEANPRERTLNFFDKNMNKIIIEIKNYVAVRQVENQNLIKNPNQIKTSKKGISKIDDAQGKTKNKQVKQTADGNSKEVSKSNKKVTIDKMSNVPKIRSRAKKPKL